MSIEAVENEQLSPEVQSLDGNGSQGLCEQSDSPENDDREQVVEHSLEREGTVSSGRFNLLSTMVGGGSLSLPLAFHKSGNAFLGPVFILLVAVSADFCFRLLIACADIIATTTTQSARNPRAKGTTSLESIVSAAFGPKAYFFSMGLVTAMCFFGTVGYAVLLRDMLEPVTDAVVPPPAGTSDGPTTAHNVTMFLVILVVTPLCTLETMTALRRAGAASMCSILIVGSCVVYRSLQCNLGLDHTSDRHSNWIDYLTYFPKSGKDLLDALPLYISCFVCHYNVLPVHNELRNPTPRRVRWLVRSTVLFATCFYLVIGFAGSMYGNCTASGTVQGNVLLDFDEDDPLLLVGRLCLALTLTMAFPMLTIPARDIVLHFWHSRRAVVASSIENERMDSGNETSEVQTQLQEPLLADENGGGDAMNPGAAGGGSETNNQSNSNPLLPRFVAAIVIFWSGALVASLVSSIDVVWDLLGSSLSILLSYLIPCGSYLVLDKQRRSLTDNESGGLTLSVAFSWFLLVLFLPLMFLSTGNAVYNTFLT